MPYQLSRNHTNVSGHSNGLKRSFRGQIMHPLNLNVGVITLIYKISMSHHDYLMVINAKCVI